MSCDPSWTAEDLAALNAAIASGAKKVKYSDREIEYQSLSDMLKARGIIRAALGCCGSTLAGGRTYGAYSSGL
jgi:methionine synthase I (cobalamin-dependent)